MLGARSHSVAVLQTTTILSQISGCPGVSEDKRANRTGRSGKAEYVNGRTTLKFIAYKLKNSGRRLSTMPKPIHIPSGMPQTVPEA